MLTRGARHNPTNTRHLKQISVIEIESRLCASNNRSHCQYGRFVILKLLLFRFLVGGLFVSAFATLGNILKPKSFAGLFGAAPSIALATLSLTIATEGSWYAAAEARSMIAGAIAFLVYACCVMHFMFRFKPPAMLLTSALLFVWLTTALGIWLVVLK
jgi:hypothetical protein